MTAPATLQPGTAASAAASPSPLAASPAGDPARPSRHGSAAPVVDARDIARAFDGRGVLRGVDLEIAKGEFVVLLGRSGSGKSTLLRILARLDREFQGRLHAPTRPAVVFQDARLLPWARVDENVTLGLRSGEAKARALAALEEVGLQDHANAWPRTLSGGEAQRVALARALGREPELLLMDEPFGALDALTRIKMHRLLRKLCARHTPAVLLVTHDVDEAILLGDRILVLTEGRLSLDVPVDLPEHGRRASPDFATLRRRLLLELGVGDDDQ